MPRGDSSQRAAEDVGWPETEVSVQAGFGDIIDFDTNDLVFTGQIFLYSERPVSADNRARLSSEAKVQGHRLVFRSAEYVKQRQRGEKPLAFISHDSRDKTRIAAPLARQLQLLMCPVWYDEFSLKVGDSLRESIERGIKECRRCVLVLTPQFLSNEGWTKREYDSIFTREMIEKSRVVLPVWEGVTAEQIYSYSPALADRMALQWSAGVEAVARKLAAVLNDPNS